VNDPVAIQPLLVLQHIGCEPPAAYEDELLDRGLTLERVQLDQGEPLPDWRPYAGILAMGGPMGTYEADRHPWLAAEMRLIAEAVRADKPFWGVCLGAQLLAASLGADVFPGPQPEVGVLPVDLTPEAASDPVFSAAPPSFDAFHWHGDTYTLPPGAVHLAHSASYEQQAFVFRNAYALQFHLEVAPSMVAEWGRVFAYAASLQRLPGEDPLADLVQQATAVAPSAIPLARELFARWLLDVVGVRGQRPAKAIRAIQNRSAVKSTI
jgi:GMP synthase (glutamine-hydrolysing)